MEFVIVIHTAQEGGYWAEVPALEGCFAQGDTIEDLLQDAQGAITSHLEALREDGRPGPPRAGNHRYGADAGADVGVRASPGRQVQLSPGLQRAGLPGRVMHLAEVLHAAYRAAQN